MPSSSSEPRPDVSGRFSRLLTEPTCRALRSAVRDGPCHLVGGAPRDALLGLDRRDLDVIVDGAGDLVAQRLARQLSARHFELGAERFAAYRVVAEREIIDIWDRAGSSLERDLRRRDFTIHSFAVDVRTGAVIDPAHGLSDLERKLLRATSPESFTADPLRVLRLCRFAAQLHGFEAEQETRVMARQSAPHLTEMAAQRTRYELELLFGQPTMAPAIGLLFELGLYPDLWLGQRPAGRPTGAVGSEWSAALRELEECAHRLAAATDLSAARMALLFSALPAFDEIDSIEAVTRFQDRGYLTKAAARRVARLLRWPRLPEREAEQRWFLHRLGELWPSAVSFLVARSWIAPESELAPASIAAIEALVADSADELFDPPPFVTGDDLQDELAIPPGARLGRMLARVRRAQIEGRVSSRRQALDLARGLDAETLPEEGEDPVI